MAEAVGLDAVVLVPKGATNLGGMAPTRTTTPSPGGTLVSDTIPQNTDATASDQFRQDMANDRNDEAYGDCWGPKEEG